MFYFTVSLKSVFYTYSTFQFGPAIFQELSSPAVLVAPMLDSPGLDH